MRLTKAEQETIVLYNQTDDPVSITTYDNALAKKFIKAGFEPVRTITFNKDQIGYEFEIPKKSIVIRPKKQLSDEQAAKLVSQLKSTK